MINTGTQQIESFAQELLVESVRDGRKSVLSFEGCSMLPLIKTGDEIFFEQSGNIRFADLVVYKKNSHFIVHRFILKRKIGNEEFFILKGDNSFRFDEPVPADEIVGRVTKVKRGNEILFLNTFKGRLKSLLYFSTFYIGSLLFSRGALGRKGVFVKERRTLQLIIKDVISRQEKEELLNLAKESINWQYITDKIKYNFFSPICLKKLIELGLKEYVHKQLWQKLEDTNRLQIAQDTSNRHILSRLLREFNARNIEVLILKGTQVGIELYEDTYYRWMSDVDLVLRPEDWLRANEALLSIGFKRLDKKAMIKKWGLKYLDSHIDFYKDGLKLEVKSSVWPVDFPYFDFDLWQRTRPAQLAEQGVYFPSYEDTLLLAVVNLARHKFSGLIWFLDIKKIIDKFHSLIDWDRFLSTAKKYDLSTLVYYSFYFTNSLMTLNLPIDFTSRLKPNFFRDKLFNFFWDRDVILFKKEGHTFKAKIPFEFVLVLFCGKFSPSPKKLFKYIGYLLRVIFPPRDYLQEKYDIKNNSILLLKFYLLRFFNFLNESIFVFYRLFFRE